MKRKRRAGGNPNRRLEITNGISGWCGANTSRQVCDFSRSDRKARLHVPGGLIGQSLYQWEGVIQLSHSGRAPCGMTGVFISTKPSNTAEPLDVPTLAIRITAIAFGMFSNLLIQIGDAEESGTFSLTQRTNACAAFSFGNGSTRVQFW